MTTMRFEQMIAYLREKPGENCAKRAGWEWAFIVWRDGTGFYRGDAMAAKSNYIRLDDLVADDWIACAPYGKAL